MTSNPTPLVKYYYGFPTKEFYLAADVEALLTDPRRLAAYLSSGEFLRLLDERRGITE